MTNPTQVAALRRAYKDGQAAARQPDASALREALERFVEWGGLWLHEKERRENFQITPGTLPPNDFIDRPARLNELLAQLTIEGREVLDAALPPSAPPRKPMKRVPLSDEGRANWEARRAAEGHFLDKIAMPSAPPALDVERLTRAWISVLSSPGDDEDHHHPGCLPPAGDCPVGAEIAEFAPVVAAEYARLAQDRSPEPSE